MKKLINSLLIVTMLFVFTINSYSQYERKVIYEEFTEVWCGACAYIAPMINKWIESHPDYNSIFYYSYFIDKNHQKVTVPEEDYQFRKTFYNLPFYPYARINAEIAPNAQYPGYPTDTNKINMIINTMSKTTPVKIDIDFTNNGHSGKVKIDVTSEESLTSNLFVYMVEKYHKYIQQSNGLSEFHNIMRKSLPDADGTLINFEAGKPQTFEFDYELPPYVNTDLYAVVIVQDLNSQHIYNSESQFKSYSTDVKDELPREVNLYPNPAKDFINISFGNRALFVDNIIIYDALGNKIKRYDIKQEILNLLLDLKNSNENLPMRIYFLKIQTQNEKIIKKFIIE